MRILRPVFADQLSPEMASLQNCDKARDVVLLCEVMEEASYVPHHKKKIAFLFSAMRHFANELRANGYTVEYVTLDDPDNSNSLTGEANRALRRYNLQNVVLTQPGEYRVQADFDAWAIQEGISFNILQDDRFLCSTAEFQYWATGRKELRMEYFYRDMRKRYNILMTNGKPVGGRWNYDASNRKPPSSIRSIPAHKTTEPDTITMAVFDLVNSWFPDNFGMLDTFGFAVTREDAHQVLAQFIRDRLPLFGDYQDAMLEGEAWMFHAHISLYLNAGLLLPRDCIRAALDALDQKTAPLNAVEGFVRQILGWREFVRGIYWLKMPAYAASNFFNAKRSLPSFYWTANTPLNCLHQCVSETRDNAYAHHIQRLMVLGNFALLCGIDPDAVNEWYLSVYADAFEWVELPNVTGMALFADGGLLASKPYAAGGAYINKMSNYCSNCRYKPGIRNGPSACPFNYLYWNFLAQHRPLLGKNHRLAMTYRSYDRFSEQKKQNIANDSKTFLTYLDTGKEEYLDPQQWPATENNKK